MPPLFAAAPARAQCRNVVHARLERPTAIDPAAAHPVRPRIRGERRNADRQSRAHDRLQPGQLATQAVSTSDNEQLIDTRGTSIPASAWSSSSRHLRAELDGWGSAGVADAIDLRRSEDGDLSALIIDFKSTTAARMEHRLQIAFYREMLEPFWPPEGIQLEIELGILYRGAPADSRRTGRSKAPCAARRCAGNLWRRTAFSNESRTPTRSAVMYARWSSDENSEARRNLATDFEQLPYHLNFVCDGCLYNQLCLRQSAETDDLSLIPFMQRRPEANSARRPEFAIAPSWPTCRCRPECRLGRIPQAGHGTGAGRRSGRSDRTRPHLPRVERRSMASARPGCPTRPKQHSSLRC